MLTDRRVGLLNADIPKKLRKVARLICCVGLLVGCERVDLTETAILDAMKEPLANLAEIAAENPDENLRGAVLSVLGAFECGKNPYLADCQR